MLKIGVKFVAENNKVDVTIVDPSKKELTTATEEEKFLAQAFKEVFDENLLKLLEEKINVE